MRDTRLLFAAAAATTFVVLSGSSTALMLRKPKSLNLGQRPSRGLCNSCDTQRRPTPGSLRTRKRGGGGGVFRLRASWIDEQVSLGVAGFFLVSVGQYRQHSATSRLVRWRKMRHDFRSNGQLGCTGMYVAMPYIVDLNQSSRQNDNTDERNARKPTVGRHVSCTDIE